MENRLHLPHFFLPVLLQNQQHQLQQKQQQVFDELKDVNMRQQVFDELRPCKQWPPPQSQHVRRWGQLGCAVTTSTPRTAWGAGVALAAHNRPMHLLQHPPGRLPAQRQAQLAHGREGGSEGGGKWLG